MAPHAEEEEFIDATDEHPTINVDLHKSFKDCERAIIKFFNNELAEAMDLMKPWGQTSMYHSLGTSIFEFIPAMLTFDHAQIARAAAALKTCMAICNKHKKIYTFAESIGTLIRKPNYNTYTDTEAHAELCYAETLLLQAAMAIMEGEDLTGLIKGTIKVKTCYSTYKDCAKILDKKEWESEVSKAHFESGVRLGTATFNVMISLLPPRIITLLEFVGFSGNKDKGLAELEAASHSPGLRSVLCDLTLLGYHLVICHFIDSPGDIPACERILMKQLKVYPQSIWFLVFQARLQLLRGKYNEAIQIYHVTIHTQDTWKQFQHVCHWEIMWANCLKMSWREASHYSTYLVEGSTWSRTIYSYFKASITIQSTLKMDEYDKEECDGLMRKAPTFKQRIVGKSLPMEKFVIRRCSRYWAQDGHLVLPAIELMCLWNMFHPLAKNERAVHNVLKLIERTLKHVENSPEPWMRKYDADNRALLQYLHGCCLAAMKLPGLALVALDTVFRHKNDIKEDTFLLPFALVEMAMCYDNLNQSRKALQLLNDARKKYSGYSLESRLHFRIHSKIEFIKNKI